ncbi:MAG: glycoside hydrolase family 95 protein [Planctomycetota bacterium]|jgi:alpha-L-fucosidase 2
MKYVKAMVVLTVIAAGCSTLGTQSTGQSRQGWDSLKLWYDKPAQKWTEALPVGNGRLGAMVFGTIETEQLQLNEDTVWAGKPIERDRAGAHRHLAEARRLIFEGKYVEGQKLVQREFMGERLIRSYQTLGDLKLRFPGGLRVTDYRRQLDLDTAIASVTYRMGKAVFTREVFSSPVDQCIVNLSRPADFVTETIAPDRIVMIGQATQDGQHKGVKFEALLRIIPEGGKLTATEKGLRLENANAATLLIVAGTDYRRGDPRLERNTAPCDEHM